MSSSTEQREHEQRSQPQDYQSDGDNVNEESSEDDGNQEDDIGSDGYGSDERGLSRDFAYHRAVRREDEGLRAFARRYKPACPVEIAQREAMQSIQYMRSIVLPPAIGLAHFYSPATLLGCPIRLSYLPFYTDDSVDLELRFTQPMGGLQFDQAVEDVFGKDGEDLVRCLQSDWDLPLRNPRDPRNHYQAHDQVRTFLSYLRWSRRKGFLEYGPCLLDYTKMSHSLLPSSWPWPDQCGDVQLVHQGSNFYAERLTHYWKLEESFDWMGCGPGWQDTVYGPGVHGTTPPHLFCFLAHEAIPAEDAPVSIPELHYVTFLMRERLRDPGWIMHRYHPIMLFNFDGVNIRITQAHFDGECLHLRRSDPVELLFTSSDLSSFKMALRWALAKPLSTTLRGRVDEALAEGADADSFAPPTPSRKAAVRT